MDPGYEELEGGLSIRVRVRVRFRDEG